MLTKMLTKCSQDCAAQAGTRRHGPDGRSEKTQLSRHIPKQPSTRWHPLPRLKPLWPQGRAGSIPAPGTLENSCRGNGGPGPRLRGRNPLNGCEGVADALATVASPPAADVGAVLGGFARAHTRAGGPLAA
jgi:hypothetical protein